MKILLTNPATRVPLDANYERFFIKAGSRWPWTTIKRKQEKNCNIFFPFYLAYAANILRKKGYAVDVIDGVALDLTEKEFIRKVIQIRPSVFLIETTTHAISFDLALVKKIKKMIPRLKVVLTGPHATVFAREILTENQEVDFIIKGEYEFLLAELIDNFAGQAQDKQYKTDGLAYRRGKEIWVSEKKGLIEDVNSLPYPAFDLFPCNDAPDLAIYGDGICTYRPAVTLHASRGCPFGCNFCLWTQVMYGDSRKYRMFKPQRVVDEMEYVIKNFGAREIYFDDDDFCVNKKHVLDICREIKKRKLKIHWSCMGDAMASDEEMIKKMAEAGCIFMKFGVESGNKEILRNIGKPLDPQKAIRTAKLCRKYGIWSHATFCFGLKGETMETMEETLKLANKIKFDSAQASITTPFPGTRYYNELVENGYLKKISWDKFDGTQSCVMDTENLTSEQIEKFRKKAIRSMILNKMIDPIWVTQYFKRNILLVKNYGFQVISAPFKALYYTFLK